jgi:hypothetical protein
VITVIVGRRTNARPDVSARRMLTRAVASGCVAALLLTSAACSTHSPEPAHTPQPAHGPVTLSAPPPETGECGPDRLARCVPGLADFNEELYHDVLVNPPAMSFGRWPQSTSAPDSLPADCERIPRLGTGTGSELDVTYGAATDAHRAAPVAAGKRRLSPAFCLLNHATDMGRGPW